MIVARERPEYNYEHLPQPTKKYDKKESRRLQRESRRKKIIATCTLLGCFLLGLFVSYYFAKVVILGYRITATEKELAELRKENENLASEIDRISSLEYIEKVAKNELGMIEPGKENIIMVAVASSSSPSQDLTGVVQSQEHYIGTVQGCTEITGIKEKVEEKNPIIKTFAGMLGINAFSAGD